MSEAADERFWKCVKNLNPDLHLGGYPARAIVIETAPGWYILYKTDLRPDKAMNLALSIARNEQRPWTAIHCVNQTLKTRVDTIRRSTTTEMM